MDRNAKPLSCKHFLNWLLKASVSMPNYTGQSLLPGSEPPIKEPLYNHHNFYGLWLTQYSCGMLSNTSGLPLILLFKIQCGSQFKQVKKDRPTFLQIILFEQICIFIWNGEITDNSFTFILVQTDNNMVSNITHSHLYLFKQITICFQIYYRFWCTCIYLIYFAKGIEDTDKWIKFLNR